MALRVAVGSIPAQQQGWRGYHRAICYGWSLFFLFLLRAGEPVWGGGLVSLPGRAWGCLGSCLGIEQETSFFSFPVCRILRNAGKNAGEQPCACQQCGTPRQGLQGRELPALNVQDPLSNHTLV